MIKIKWEEVENLCNSLIRNCEGGLGNKITSRIDSLGDIEVKDSCNKCPVKQRIEEVIKIIEKYPHSFE